MMGLVVKIIGLLVLYIAMVFKDHSKLKQAEGRERIAYFTLTLFFVYLGIDYVVEPQLPDVTDLIKWVFIEPGKRIVGLFIVPE